MAEATTLTQTTAAPPAPTPANIGNTGSLVDLLMHDAPAAQAAAKAEQPGAAAPSAPAKAPPPGFDDPLADELFTDDKLATPEQVRAAAKLVRDEAKVALDIRRKAHNARAEAERKEAKLRHTKERTLADKSAIAATANFLQGELAELQSGDPDRFIAAIGRLSKHADPPELWRSMALKLATGAGKKVEIPDEVKQRIAQLEQQEKQRAEAATAAEHTRALAELRASHIAEAEKADAFPGVKALATRMPDIFWDAVREVKQDHFKEHGTPLDTGKSFGIIEGRLKAFSELNQPADGSNGDTTREKDSATPAVGQDGAPGRPTVAKTEPAQSSPPHKSSTVQTVPSSLTSEPARTKRNLSEAEKKEAITRQLDELGFFDALNMR